MNEAFRREEEEPGGGEEHGFTDQKRIVVVGKRIVGVVERRRARFERVLKREEEKTILINIYKRSSGIAVNLISLIVQL